MKKPKPPTPEGPPAFRTGPWPTADCLRLALLAKLQDEDSVDLVEFFRQVYPEVLVDSQEVKDV